MMFAADNPASNAGGPQMLEIKPPLTDKALNNPGMGLYLFGTTNEADFTPNDWLWDIMHIGYFREDWAAAQPDSDSEDDLKKYLDPLFDLWVKKWNKRLSFRFMSQNKHSKRQYPTPKWVFDKGVPSVKQSGIYTKEQLIPVFWDDTYLALQEKFVVQLGRCMDGRAGLEFIDIGGIGQWGEMHLSGWTPEQLEATGFTETRYFNAYRRLMNAYARAFPRTSVFLNVGDKDPINHYAVTRGIHLRQDGVTPDGPSANVGERLFKPYNRQRIICNYELFCGLAEMKTRGWDPAKNVYRGIQDPISYYHVYLLGYDGFRKAGPEIKEIMYNTARKLGFRFELSSLKCSKTLNVYPGKQTASRLLIEHTWKNTGCAPCYESYALRWTLRDGTGKTVAEDVSYPREPTTQWWPETNVTLRSVIRVPPELPAGDYQLAVAMTDPQEPSVKIQLGIEGLNTDGSYTLVTIPTGRSAVQASAYRVDFTAGLSNWQAAPGLTMKRDEAGKDSPGSLHVSGTQPGNAWSYASDETIVPLMPASRYRFSCWMKVDQCTMQPPYLKMELRRADGSWVGNANTSRYDLSQKGTWQKIMAVIETDQDTAQGRFAIERGQKNGSATVDIVIDDILVEPLETP